VTNWSRRTERRPTSVSGQEPPGTGIVGTTVELTVGPVAHGGHCVARLPVLSTSDDPGSAGPGAGGAGRVVFVRHALPGERVRALVTEERPGFLRADAVEVLFASPDRVTPPCRYAGPGGCGGCDFQHATPTAQHELKAAVVREQLTRLARLTPAEVEALGVRVEPLPGDALGWRSRVQYAVDRTGRVGFHQHRSHEVVPVDECLIAHPAVRQLPVTASRWPGKLGGVEVVASSAGDVTVFTQRRRGSEEGPRIISGPAAVREHAVGREWTVPASAFWQVHPAAPEVLAATVLELLDPQPGERAWDLYGGAGLFAAALAPRLGPKGRVTIVESGWWGVAAARRSFAEPEPRGARVRVVAADVGDALANPRWRRVDLVVADPPRDGLGAGVVRGIVARHPRAVAYVSCDPASFARDVATFAEVGWRLAALRAYDAFPMTHHVELVGLLYPGRAGVAVR